MKNLSYSDILKLNKELGKSLNLPAYQITVLSNITINLIKEILECSLRVQDINAQVKIGDYDNIAQNSAEYQDSNLIIIFWELFNLIEGLHYKAEALDEKQLEAIFEKTKLEIDLVLKNLRNNSLVLINKFSALPFSNSDSRINNLENLGAKLNQYLEDQKQVNVKLIDLNQIIAEVGISQSIDWRYFYSAKALYTIVFFKEYAQAINPFIMAVNGKAKKALIFDCDNTLWKGVLGEDGPDNIEMSEKTKDGAIFAEIQGIAQTLTRQGILIGLCTKNNADDVDQVINSHPDMQLKDEHITIKKINWLDKATNLKEIAQELNIGLDSLVFVDDSAFEVNLIKEQLPQVTVLQVPEQLYNYPKMLRDNLGLFYNLSLTKEDSQKAKKYKEQSTRQNAQSKFANMDDYFASLGLKITIFENDEEIIPRISQLTQKTNQFNLTTQRYTENDIKNFMLKEEFKVYAFSVSDKFGDSGVTGLAIINFDFNAQTAQVDTFLMSCRIIGRNIEYAFMNYLIEVMKVSHIQTVTAKYIKTSKNELTENFYDQSSFSSIESTDSFKKYILSVNKYRPKQVNYIEVIDGKKNQKSFSGRT